MLDFFSVGETLFSTLRDVGEFFLKPLSLSDLIKDFLSSIGVPTANFVGYGLLAIELEQPLIFYIFGGGILGVLGFKLLKFFFP